MSDPVGQTPTINTNPYPVTVEGPPKPAGTTATAPSLVLDAAIATMKPLGSAVAAYATMFAASPAKTNVDAFYAAANPTLLATDGSGAKTPVTIALPFRMSTNPPSPAEAKKAILFDLPPAVAKALGPAIDAVVWGRGTPEQCAQVAQALLDAAWVPTAQLGPEKLRGVLESYGIGLDCAGYAQQAAMKAVGLDPMKPADRAKFGFAPYIGNESMAGVPTSSKFTKITPADAKPGDIVSLGPPAYENIGHSLVVASNKELSETQKTKLLAANPPDKNGPGNDFVAGAGPLRAIQVDSSWGGGVGVARVTWLYDESTKKWATLAGKNGDIVIPSTNPDGPYNHPLKGIFRSKLAP